MGATGSVVSPPFLIRSCGDKLTLRHVCARRSGGQWAVAEMAGKGNGEASAGAFMDGLHAAIIAACEDLIYFCTPDQIVREANLPYARLNGKTLAETIGRPLREVIGPRVYDHRAAVLARAFAGEPAGFQDWVEMPGLGRRYFDVRYHPVRGADGGLIGVAAFGRDITALREVGDALRLYRSIVQQMSDRFAVIDRDFRYLLTNESNARWHGRPAEEFVGRRVEEFVDAERFAVGLRPALQRCFAGETVDLDLDIDGLGGESLIVAARVEPFRRVDGEVDAALVTLRDVTETRRLAQRLERLTLQDDLTGIPNRRAFEQWLTDRLAGLASALGAGRGGGEGFGVVFLDLDGFKLVNDTAGHGAGDRFLAGVADVLSAFAGDNVQVARIGGDEFGIVIDSSDAVAVEVLCARVLADLTAFRFSADGMTFRGGASLGFTMVRPQDPEVAAARAGAPDISPILQRADQACLAAKAAGGRRVQQLSANAEVAERQRAELRYLAVVEQALAGGEGFRLERMAAVDLASGETAFFEVLPRLRLADGTVAGPTLIGALAERHALSLEIDRWMVDAVLARLAADPLSGAASVNLSGLALADAGFAAGLERRLAAAPALAGRLIVELAEPQLVHLDAAALHLLRRLRRLGLRVALDGFGASFGLVTEIREDVFDLVKIDRLLVRDLDQGAVRRAAIVGVVSLAEALGLPTVAEHVEDPALLPRLRGLGVRYAQGKAVRPPVDWPLPA